MDSVSFMVSTSSMSSKPNAYLDREAGGCDESAEQRGSNTIRKLEQKCNAGCSAGYGAGCRTPCSAGENLHAVDITLAVRKAECEVISSIALTDTITIHITRAYRGFFCCLGLTRSQFWMREADQV